MSTVSARFYVAFLLLAVSTLGCTSSEPDELAEPPTSAPPASPDQPTTSTGAAPDQTTTTLEPLEPADLEVVLPVVCDFERYNGLIVKRNLPEANPSSYEQSLEVFVRRTLGDKSLPSDETSAKEIADEQDRCAALPALTFANGSHPVGKQIEATVFRTLVPVRQECSWERKDADGNVADAVTVAAGATVEIVVQASDRLVRIDGCGIFVAGTPRTESGQ